MTIQDQYIDSFRQAQEAWVDAVESFTSEAQRALGQPWAPFSTSFSTPFSAPFSFADPNETIDQVFDFWAESLDVQRNITKQVVGATISAGQRFASRSSR